MSFSEACRCCLNTSGMETATSIAALYGNGTIKDLIKTITNIEVDPSEEFPQHICQDCLARLMDADQIKKRYIESDMILHGLLSPKLEIKQEDYDIVQENVLVTSDHFSQDDSREFQRVLKKRKRRKPPSSYSCEVCPRFFPNSKKLSEHCRQHRANNDPPLHECPSCKFRSYSTKSAQNHKCGLKNICYFCHDEFEGRKPLFRHMEEHHRDNNSFVCLLSECQYKSSKVETMFYHLSSHFAPLEILCELCSMRFTNQEKYYRHRAMHNARKLYACDVCGVKIWMKQNLIRHMQRSHLNKRYFCDQCPSSFSDGSVLKQHKVRNHGLESQFTCEECDVKFVFLSQLTAHQKSHSNGRHQFSRRVRRRKGDPPESGPFHCEICNKIFTLKANKRRHVETVHLGVKKYACQFLNCSATFSQRTGLEVHYRLHTGEKPHSCQHCTFNCSDPSTLLKHLKNVHKIEKPTMKGECGIGYKKSQMQ